MTDTYHIPIKPLSVNEAWRGRRFKSPAYKRYESVVMLLLRDIPLKASPPYKITLVFGMSNARSDWDNPIKPFQDILQKRYGIDDKDIMEAHVYKQVVKKGEEFIGFSIDTV